MVKIFQKRDIAVIAAAVLLALGWTGFTLARAVPAAEAIVSVNGEYYMSIDMAKDGTYEIDSEYGRNVIEVSDGKLRMAEADCPDGLCVSQGWVTSGTQSIVCLPNRITVELSGEGQVDAVAG